MFKNLWRSPLVGAGMLIGLFEIGRPTTTTAEVMSYWFPCSSSFCSPISLPLFWLYGCSQRPRSLWWWFATNIVCSQSRLSIVTFTDGFSFSFFFFFLVLILWCSSDTVAIGQQLSERYNHWVVVVVFKYGNMTSPVQLYFEQHWFDSDFGCCGDFMLVMKLL